MNYMDGYRHFMKEAAMFRFFWKSLNSAEAKYLMEGAYIQALDWKWRCGIDA